MLARKRNERMTGECEFSVAGLGGISRYFSMIGTQREAVATT